MHVISINFRLHFTIRSYQPIFSINTIFFHNFQYPGAFFNCLPFETSYLRFFESDDNYRHERRGLLLFFAPYQVGPAL